MFSGEGMQVAEKGEGDLKWVEERQLGSGAAVFQGFYSRSDFRDRTPGWFMNSHIR